MLKAIYKLLTLIQIMTDFISSIANIFILSKSNCNKVLMMFSTTSLHIKCRYIQPQSLIQATSI